MERTIAHYQILDTLGTGAMGEVYLALDTKLDRKVALKLLPGRVADNPEWLARFRREARAVAALNHPNIVTLFSIEEHGGHHYFTMELVEGKTLAQTIPERGLPRERFFELAESLADALAAAHGKGVTHRDLKPTNIMIAADGRAKILDFGLAKLHAGPEDDAASEAATELLTEVGTMMGTVAYMSPEQVQAKEGVDHRSDIFSLGIVLWEMATHRNPFGGGGRAERMATILRDPPQHPGDMDPALRQVLERCLEKDPERRFQSALELRDRLRELHRQSPGGTVAPQPAEQPAAALENSIAVLPFTDLSAERDQEYFCDGLAEELMNALGRVPELRVAARSSAFQFKEKKLDVREIGAALGVSSVLEGSVRKAGERLRITVQLVDVADGYHVWSERFDRNWENVFEIQDDIAQSVVGSLQVRMAADFGSRLIRPQTADLEAYNLYLRARHEGNRRTVESLEQSVGLFRQALEQDADYARAHAGLADSLALLGIYGARPAGEVMPEARAAAERALEIDASLPEALTSLGCVDSIHGWAWDRAEDSFQRAIQVAPDYPLAHHWYAMTNLVPTARFDLAVSRMWEAKRLDPLSPVIGISVALVLYFARRYEAAVRELDQALKLEADFPAARLFLGRVYSEVGQHEEAIGEIGRAIELTGGSAEMYAALGYAHARAERSAEAESEIGRLEKLSESTYVSPSLTAQIEAGLGRKERALELLQVALGERAADLAWIAVRPVFDGLRGEVDFKRLLGEMGLRPRFFK